MRGYGRLGVAVRPINAGAAAGSVRVVNVVGRDGKLSAACSLCSSRYDKLKDHTKVTVDIGGAHGCSTPCFFFFPLLRREPCCNNGGG